ncbi:pyridoxamine 5'-phosphate oxidase family protein [Pseudorhodoferax sp. Leaf267]|uniref:pyridoxamine 5'-phosphate oxidase family protein n=1 Tax=Pseudorhodoferax sp. Leaf267 TaxID=1736316 RepID=UPI0006F76D58|nr:pyridoxamine 5'-phosphate oxidase family protein [Pseudorhodoferax sp. Leaf267]KQP14215.1 phosphohydrolase [Pseudorhodoferax sp. Leaf267]
MIETLAQLRGLYAAPGERALRKQLTRLDPHARRFIALSPFCVVATGGVHGGLLDASPRGGAPGFVKVADERMLLLPDAGGNNRLDTLENLLADPRLALIFLIPNVEETLRVNGRARLRDEPAFTERFDQERQRPKLVIEVAVQEVYLHCAKAFMRSQLWQPSTWPAREVLPSMNQMIHDQTDAGPVTESAQAMRARYESQLAAERLPSA